MTISWHDPKETPKETTAGMPSGQEDGQVHDGAHLRRTPVLP